ncbi:permease-like cell division protein FtsX [Stenotrophobium rhamnosiphilum]|uniref:Cell division protein FtsX n=1 Tax=Stenotrophobium rhamnosiphilum TaxID=2029166 RepID=A0A2T5MGJ8_9GAMM|nr:permease-like cell division protein FtsX [Stenotrophobium rhamnosiphilum]PTU31659.1 cell division protein FtsX [Stenotrophobium rhamnosiphilum]
MPRAAASSDRRQTFFSRLLEEHARVFFFSLGKLWQNPAGTLLTALVIGITLALPAGLHALINNVDKLSYSWEGAAQSSLFLKDSVSAERGKDLARELNARPGVARTTYISRDQALAEFRKLSGFGEALDILDNNPLPAVITVTPMHKQSRDEINALVTDLSNLPEVDMAKLDQKWLERLYGIIDLLQRGVMVIAVLLSLAVIVTVANTIRLDIQARREEIIVMKLIGAPNSFIRRPFLYTGLWYGFTGSVVALIFVGVGMAALTGPVQNLAGLYESNFSLSGLSFFAVLQVFGAGIVLGWLGAFLTVSRHLSKIEPH